MTAETHGKFNQIVLEGLYLEKGMASFADLISKDEADAIHAYLIDEAWKVYREQQTGTAAAPAPVAPSQLAH